MDNEDTNSFAASTTVLTLQERVPPEPPPAPSPQNGHPTTSPPLQHSSAHLTRKAFFRASALLQEAYYIWREHTYDQPLIPHLPAPNVIHLVYDPTMEAHDIPYEHYALTIFPFPHAATPTPAIRNAVLTSCMCDNAAVVMSTMLTRLLSPSTTLVSELSARITPASPLLAVAHPPDPPVLVHTFHRCRLVSGEEFALDLTGAQYGWGDGAPLAWERYVEERVRGPLFAVPGGGLRVVEDAYAVAMRRRELGGGEGEGHEGGGEDGPRQKVAWWCLGRAWDALGEMWEEEAGMGLAELVQVAEEEVWVEKRKGLLEFLREGVRGFAGCLPELVGLFGGQVGLREAEEVRERVRSFREAFPGLDKMVDAGFKDENGGLMGFNAVQAQLWNPTCENPE